MQQPPASRPCYQSARLASLLILKCCTSFHTSEIRIILADNFQPQERYHSNVIDDDWVRSTWETLVLSYPDLIDQVRSLPIASPGVRGCIAALMGGHMRGREFPEDQDIMRGVQRCLTMMLQSAVRGPIFRQRSYVRTREGDEYGYESDEQYTSENHPGNLGM